MSDAWQSERFYCDLKATVDEIKRLGRTYHFSGLILSIETRESSHLPGTLLLFKERETGFWTTERPTGVVIKDNDNANKA